MIDDSKERERERARNMINEAIRICTTNGHTMWQGVTITSSGSTLRGVSYLQFPLSLPLTASK